MAKLFYNITEVSQQLKETAETIRYWEKEFGIKVERRSGGREVRQYNHKNIEKLKLIRNLIREHGYTIDGAREHLRKGTPKATREDALIALDKVLAKLNGIKAQLNTNEQA